MNPSDFITPSSSYDVPMSEEIQRSMPQFVRQIQELESKAKALDEIDATLELNCELHFGWRFRDDQSVLQKLVQVLEEFLKLKEASNEKVRTESKG